ncbi:solute carrier family 13 (sodium-dependent dicarboxylate transporter), member 2/3/5 [Chromohalobacter canadensis]|uniref:Solute carrier family 13 (Sodium-dependent dicarboxylate transporter), member 2/3/5 n=1 Tax=Chromohalobacter canadensis TaxID=141389 RepID=A0A285VTE0_9GAMM|nr:DASS family sodium-coupled anion symporter [Chromohalobacter canadensis]SOC57325.1 solute carrier family 13 (sodium-dependent dicarboxylate transporter), member 2/3/5 [Chromohalobacter canadensis]
MSETTHDARSPSAAQIGLWLGPLWVILCLVVPAPAGMSSPAWACVGFALLMATWWATEAIPIPATSLLPMVLAPVLGIDELDAVAASYADPIIYLFLGGFLLGIAMQRWNLHRRIALKVLSIVGQKPRQQIAGFMIATGFISMWVSNTATSIMMLPIGMSVVSLLGDGDSREVSRYATALLLAIAYSASIGGVATLIGTPPNALLAGYLSGEGIDIGFAQWMTIGLPVSIVMMAVTWWWLTYKGFDLQQSDDGGEMIRRELESLGTMTAAERRVGLIFLIAAATWMLRPLLNQVGLDWLSDTTIALAAGIGLFLVPSGDKARGALLDWDSAKELPWGVLLLFGGGLALAGMIKSSGLAEWIAQQLSIFSVFPLLMLVGIIVLVIIFLTEVTSNTATAAAFLPLLGALAISLDMDPLLITVPAAIAASCAFMMPVATPPNAIVFATGHMKIQSMIRAGLLLNIVGTLLITLITVTLLRLLWA